MNKIFQKKNKIVTIYFHIIYKIVQKESETIKCYIRNNMERSV